MAQTDHELHTELKQHIVADLELEDTLPEDIDTEASLFGEGLGLDSIDAVELVVMLERHYGIQLTDMKAAKSAFASVRALADFVTENQSG